MGFIITAVLALLVDIINLSWRALKVEISSSTTGKLKCPHCGKEYSKDDTFCGGCGHALEKLVCPKCGKEYAHGDFFCKKCGEKLSETDESVTEEEESVTEEELEEIALTYGEKENLQCPHCGKKYSKGDAFCGGCGHVLEKLVCPKCGKEYAHGDSFCKKCGEKLCVLLKE